MGITIYLSDLVFKASLTRKSKCSWNIGINISRASKGSMIGHEYFKFLIRECLYGLSKISKISIQAGGRHKKKSVGFLC